MVQKLILLFLASVSSAYGMDRIYYQADLNRLRLRLAGLSQCMVQAPQETPKSSVGKSPETPKNLLEEIRLKRELKPLAAPAPREFDLADELHKIAGEKKSILGLVDAVKHEDKQVKEIIDRAGHDEKFSFAKPAPNSEREVIEKEAAAKKAELEKAKEYALTLNVDKLLEDIQALDKKLEAQIKTIQDRKASKDYEKLYTVLEQWPLKRITAFSSAQDLKDVTDVDIEPIKVQLNKVLEYKDVLVKALKSPFTKQTKDELTQSMQDIREAKTSLSEAFNGIEGYFKSREFQDAATLLLSRTQGKQPSAINYKILPKVLLHFSILIDASLCIHKDVRGILQSLLVKIENFKRIREKISQDIEKDTLDMLIRDYMLSSYSQKNEHFYTTLLKNVSPDRWHAIKAIREKQLKELFKFLELYAQNQLKAVFNSALVDYKKIDERYKEVEKDCHAKIEEARELCQKELKVLEGERNIARTRLQEALVREIASQGMLTEKVQQAQKLLDEAIKQALLPELSKQLWNSAIAKFVGEILRSYDKLERIQLYETVLPAVIAMPNILQSMFNRINAFTVIPSVKREEASKEKESSKEDDLAWQ